MSHVLAAHDVDVTISDDQPDPDHLASDVFLAVLAAGEGRRMHSRLPKPLHPVAGIPMVRRVLDAGSAARPDQTVLVVNQTLRDRLAGEPWMRSVLPVIQPDARGTGDAVALALDYARAETIAVVLFADHPLLTGELVSRLVEHARQTSALVTLIGCVVDDAAGYGRVERDGAGNVVRIVERADDDPACRRGVTEINSGMMAIQTPWAKDALSQVSPSGATGEIYLTDLVKLAVQTHQSSLPWPVASIEAPPEVAHGINDRQQLGENEARLWERKRQEMLASGVSLVGGETIFIDGDVEIGQDTVILPYTILQAGTWIGSDCRIGPRATLSRSVIGDRVTVVESTVTDARIDHDADVGPYAHVRGGTEIGAGAHIGNYAELKNATIGAGSKIGHFSYVGDTRIGVGVNIGAGVVTANFDGTRKHRTDIGDRAFVGSDTVLRAPVRVGDDAVTGAGSIVTKDVPNGATAVGMPARITRRGRQSDGSPGSES